MTTLYQNIRAALQKRAATAAGFPAGQAIEGLTFTPIVGTPYARMTLLPSMGRALSVSSDRKQHVGNFQVDLFYPPGRGTGTVETAADAVKAVFNPGARLPQGGNVVIIDWAERSGIITADPQWLQCPVTVRWRCFAASN